MGTEYHHRLYQNLAKSLPSQKKAPVVTAEGRTPKYELEVWSKKDLLLTGATDKDREGKKDRRVYSETFVSYNGRRAVTVQRISQKYGR